MGQKNKKKTELNNVTQACVMQSKGVNFHACFSLACIKFQGASSSATQICD